jgi:hypothetical protein
MIGFQQGSSGDFSRTISNAMYSRQAISAAQSAFKQHCLVSVRPQGEGMVTVTVKPTGEAAKAPTQAVLEFWNFVLDSEAQRRLELD